MSQLLKGQPNNLTNENCNSMYASSGKWHDYNCDRQQHFICEKTGKILQNQQFKRNFDLIKSKYLNNYHNETSQIFLSGLLKTLLLMADGLNLDHMDPALFHAGKGHAQGRGHVQTQLLKKEAQIVWDPPTRHLHATKVPAQVRTIHCILHFAEDEIL